MHTSVPGDARQNDPADREPKHGFLERGEHDPTKCTPSLTQRTPRARVRSWSVHDDEAEGDCENPTDPDEPLFT